MKIWAISSILINLLIHFPALLIAQDQTIAVDTTNSVKDKYIVQRIIISNGRMIEGRSTPSPPTPPPGFSRKPVIPPKTNVITAENTLSEVPAFDWSFGCSATSAAMIAGYYDRTGFSNMYAGPTNGGIMPLDNSAWPTWIDSNGDTRSQCPLSATHMGLDGRSTRGHVDDYWVYYLSEDPDPFIGNWNEHSYGDCTGDYMKTNQSTYGIVDGSTRFYFFNDGAPIYDSDLEYYGIQDEDGCYGLKLFYESRGYNISTAYSQYIEEQGLAYGFSFDQYCAEIDAGRPVMIHVEGHTMVGIGYNDETNQVYLHDTWDYNEYSMTWGGYYTGMLHYGVTIVTLQTPLITVTNGADLSLDYIQTNPSPPHTDWPFGQFSLTSDGAGPTVNSVTIYLSGSYEGLEGTQPFRLFAANSNNFLEATAIGSDAAPSGGSVTFSSVSDELPDETRYYWITADLSESAEGTINGAILYSTDLDIMNSTITGSSDYGYLNTGEDVSLPVELSSFSAYALDGENIIKWTTQSELNNWGYLLSRSVTCEGPFIEIASYLEHENLKGRGNTSDASDYTYHDLDIIKGCNYYYQLISVDYDGQKTTYGPVHCSGFAEDMQFRSEEKIPLTFALHQNYPNPFNPSTIINYELPITNEVEISIYNVLGEKLITLLKKYQSAGRYSVEWDASGYANGVYYYILSTDAGFVQSKKLVLLK